MCSEEGPFTKLYVPTHAETLNEELLIAEVARLTADLAAAHIENSELKFKVSRDNVVAMARELAAAKEREAGLRDGTNRLNRWASLPCDNYEPDTGVTCKDIYDDHHLYCDGCFAREPITDGVEATK